VQHLYVHVPFCTHICPYCAFHKERNLTPALKAFLPALQQELAWARREFDLRPTTIFFGGGTPTALSLSQLESLFAHWPFQGVDEFTFEANPLTISPAKAAVLRAAGVNRISLGVQAFDEQALRLLGRTHRREGIHASMRSLRRAGFSNINIDLMFSLPGQTLDDWQATLREAVALEPNHISTYNLTYEEDTEFLHRFQRGEFTQEESLNRDMAEAAVDILGAAGFHPYEISNFARPGFECHHNAAIWDGASYLGLGPSACSTIGNVRWKNTPHTQTYAHTLAATGAPPREFELLTPAQRHQERILLGLRTTRGIPAAWIASAPALPDLLEEGLLESAGDRYRLTRAGRLVADSITELLV
jgi:oxygen-independent coproporphyrinogen-3 oxidase